MRAKSNCHFTRDPKIFRKVPIYIKMSEPNLFVKFPNRGYIIQHLHTNVHRESQIQIVAGRKKMSWKSTEISKSGFLRPFFCQLSWNWRFKVVVDIIGDRWQWWWRNGCVLAFTGCGPGFDSAEIVAYMQREQMHAQRARCMQTCKTHARKGGQRFESMLVGTFPLLLQVSICSQTPQVQHFEDLPVLKNQISLKNFHSNSSSPCSSVGRALGF